MCFVTRCYSTVNLDFNVQVSCFSVGLYECVMLTPCMYATVTEGQQSHYGLLYMFIM